MADREVNAESVSFAAIGPERTKTTCFGKRRCWSNLTKLDIAFLITSIIAILCDIGFTCKRISNIEKDDPDFTFAILVLVNSVICLYYAVIGIIFERPVELGILILASITLWIYLWLNYVISVKSDIKLARVIVFTILGIPMILMGVIIWRDYLRSRELTFRTVGANEDLQKMCKQVFMFIDLLKADLQISISMAILVMNDGKHLTLEDKILLPVVLLVSVGMLAFGYCSVRFESLLSVVVYLILWSTLPYYDLYLVYHAVKDLLDKTDDTKMEISLYTVLFVTSAISLALRTASLIFGIRVFMNFGKGLARRMYGEPYEVI